MNLNGMIHGVAATLNCPLLDLLLPGMVTTCWLGERMRRGREEEEQGGEYRDSVG
jgi:hypothetical protein